MHTLTFVPLSITSILLVFLLTLYTLLCFVKVPGNRSKLSFQCMVRPLWLDLSLSLSHPFIAFLCLQHAHTLRSVCFFGQEQWAHSLTFTQKPGELAVEMMMKWCKQLKPQQEGTCSQSIKTCKTAGNNNEIITVSWLSITLSIFTVCWIYGY